MEIVVHKNRIADSSGNVGGGDGTPSPPILIDLGDRLPPSVTATLETEVGRTAAVGMFGNNGKAKEGCCTQRDDKLKDKLMVEVV